MNVQDIASPELIDGVESGRSATARAGITDLLEISFRSTWAVLGAVGSWDAPSPCAGWTVRQTGNHLAGSLMLLTRVAEGEPVDASERNAQRMADTDCLGQRPAAAFEAIARRAVAAFSKPETLARHFDMPVPDAPGSLLASICLLESLVHGWDIATGAGIDYRPSAAVVTAVREFASAAVDDQLRARGLFGPALPTDANAAQLTVLLGYLGRRG
jgi:uncharacterized protein (TIGR03086 family)